MIPPEPVEAAAPANPYFERTWSYTDAPVANGQASRTWMWGPEAFTGEMHEQYAESPNGQRTVQYFDKSRMEITYPGADQSSLWYVTNGLLVNELMTGRMQVGDNGYVDRQPAEVNIAGDADDSRGATYRFMSFLTDEAATAQGIVINKILTPGAATNMYLYSDEMAAYGVAAAHYVPETQHAVAAPFWDFMNSSGLVYDNGAYTNASIFQNPFFATGFPVTEAYWADVKVGGEYKDVLLQCFERRCLTYTPSNSAGWKVEAGNVGQHYYSWRYGEGATPPSPPPSDNPAPPADDPSPSPTPEPPASDPEGLPDVVLSQAWQYPQSTIAAAWTEATGLRANGEFASRFQVAKNAVAMQYLYNLATAEIGDWNHDTTGFYDWLVWYFGTWVGSGSRDGLLEHVRSQVITGIYEPQSELGRRVRQVESVLHSQSPFEAPWAYWVVLANPARWAMQVELPLVLQSGHGSLSRAGFESHVHDFISLRGSGPYLGFGSYLANNSYIPYGY